jgi:CheY-like chemotaxis protein/HPt (histidine-containing phosphotransfer) domain-containing protein
LVVDDDPISRELVALLLGSEGHRVTKASSGMEALDALSQIAASDPPNAILVDLRMPGLSGGKLAQRLRSQAGVDVRILAMSASEPVSTSQFDGFLRKPIDTALLATMLDGGGSSAHKAAAKPKTAPNAFETEILNENIYARLKSMMPAASLQEIFDTCIADIRKRLPEMSEWLKVGDDKSFRQSAHTIKGGSSMIGATRISEIAAKLELGSYKPGEGRKILEDLSSACNELEGILLERKAEKLW